MFHVLDPAEIDFTFDERRASRTWRAANRCPIVPEALARTISDARAGAHRRAAREARPSSRIDYTLFNTGMPLDHALFSYLSIRERLTRTR